MGYLKQLVLQDFKSWRDRQLIGPFKRFNCVIGPNGSGKSNVMDALSFVMGEKTTNLRVKSVRELIHGANIGKPVSKTASVNMVYCEENGEEKSFSRIILDLFAHFNAFNLMLQGHFFEPSHVLVRSMMNGIYSFESKHALFKELDVADFTHLPKLLSVTQRFPNAQEMLPTLNLSACLEEISGEIKRLFSQFSQA